MLKQNVPLFILIFLAFLTRFLFLAYPSEVVFDEVHFGKFVFAYFSGEYYFDIHPPLAKLMIGGFYKIFGEQTEFDFDHIGETFNKKSLFILRFLPAFFGALFVILIYKLILAFGLSKKSAILGGSLILLENAFLVESKFILTDIFLLFFGFGSLYFFFLARKEGAGPAPEPRRRTSTLRGRQARYGASKNLFFILAGVFAALSFSIKWTGLSFLGIILFFVLIDLIKNFKLKGLLLKSVYFILLPLLVYFFVFFIHFELLPNPGPGSAYMSQAFQLTLKDNETAKDAIKARSVFGKFIELNKAMYSYSAALEADHPDKSYFYQWPIMKKPIWYWNKKIDGSTDSPQSAKSANIYFFGNPLIWWLVALIVPFSLFISQIKKVERKILPYYGILIFGFLVNLLPFIFVKRVTFLYHYLPALTFGILILVLFIEKIPSVFKANVPLKFFIGFLFLVFIIFLLVSPLTYGFFLPEKINLYYLKIIGFFN